MEKKLRQSKTFWVNFFLVAAGALSGAMATEAMSPQLVGYGMAIVGVVNIVLRMLTRKSISK